MIQATGIDRQIRIPIEGVNRYRYAIPQSIDIPIGIFNRLLLSRVPGTCLVVFKQSTLYQPGIPVIIAASSEMNNTEN